MNGMNNGNNGFNNQNMNNYQELNNQPLNNNQHEEPLKKSYSGLLIIFMVISLLLAGFIFYDKVIKKNEPINQCENNKQEENKEIQEQEDTTNIVDKKNIVGNYKSQDYSLYLRNDGSFNLQYELGSYVGTYIVNDNTIVLDEKVEYGTDACFRTTNLNKHTGTINSDNTISIKIGNKSQIFKEGNIEPESEGSLSWYVLNPIDGVTPKGWGEPWGDCNNR